jgi:uncharacterized protein YbjT (DUF2867 family)
MKVVIIGGSGLIGSKLAAKLREMGQEVIASSPASGVNTITGQGLSEVLTGAAVVIDLANSPSFEDKAVMEFFQTSGQNLLAAEKMAGVKHHVALSIVGSDRLPDSGYLRAKLVQENLIKKSGVPYTIIRSTQFFEFVGAIAEAGAVGQEIHISPDLFQPTASDDVVAALAEVAMAAPLNGTIEIAGPEKRPMDEFVSRYLKAVRDTRKLVADEHARYFGTELHDGSLVPAGHARLGTVRFDDWMSQHPPKK